MIAVMRVGWYTLRHGVVCDPPGWAWDSNGTIIHFHDGSSIPSAQKTLLMTSMIYVYGDTYFYKRVGVAIFVVTAHGQYMIGGVGGCGGVVTSWRPRPWYYVDNTCRGNLEDALDATLMTWGGVGSGEKNNINVYTDGCQSLEDGRGVRGPHA